MVSMLLIALVAGLVVSLVACALALGLFPWFRSGERKPGDFRPDQSTGSHGAVVVSRGRGKRVRATRSSELPLVGGGAIVVAIVVAAVGSAFFLGLSLDQWELLGILLGATVAYGAVGFLDDWRKVHDGQGLSELAKLVGVFVVSLAAAIALNRLVPSARFAYSPYSDIPLLGGVLRNTHYAWIAFFVAMTATVASTTSLAVDFSDGLDGLAGGLIVSAGLSFAIIILSEGSYVNWPAVAVLLALVGAALGYLPFNWPSGYKAHGQGHGPRRARLIMGDTGSLALGGTLALVTVVTRLELLLLFIGGVFVLEGVSALISARILVRFFRKFLSLPRFGADRGFAHTEFPLPFLATPMHHHYDLLGWDRRRIVYGAWALGAGLATLGVASAIAPVTWERYLARFVSLIVILLVWQSGPWTRSFFIGLVRARNATPNQPMRLGLFYGFPYRLFGFRLFGRVDVVSTTEDILKTPAERLSLWQRTSVFDARSTLGYYCYRGGSYQDAVRVWSRIPKRNLAVRPEIAALLVDAQHRAALEADADAGFPFGEVPAAQSAPFAPAEDTGSLPYAAGASAPELAEEGATDYEPAYPALPPEVAGAYAGPPLPLWSANGWTAAMGRDESALPYEATTTDFAHGDSPNAPPDEATEWPAPGAQPPHDW